MVAFAYKPDLAYKELSTIKVHNTVIVANGQLNLFNCKTRLSVSTRITQVSDTSSAVMIRNDKVFFTGGYQTEHRAFLCDFTKDEIEEYPNTLDRRRYHGSAYYFNRVFLFGGDIQTGKTAEKCTFTSKTWTWLLPMPTNRSAFTPCIHMQGIYLCGGNVSICHLFHIHTETYDTLQCTLPVNTWCIATFVGEDLIMENGKYRVKWNIKEGQRDYEGNRRFIP